MEVPEYKNTFLLQSRNTKFLFSKIRANETNTKEFSFYALRLMKLIAEEGLGFLTEKDIDVATPCGIFKGVEKNELAACAVSIIRAGDSMLQAVRDVIPGIPVGKILIQRDETSKEKLPILFYEKYPPNIHEKEILLCDPMLATGGSAIMAIKSMIAKGVQQKNIIFLNVVSCPEGIRRLNAEFPQVKIVTGQIDSHLNESKYIVPGLGDYGDRFFGSI